MRMTMRMQPVGSLEIYNAFGDFLSKFHTISDELKQRIFSIASPLELQKGSYLIKEGTEGEYFYFLHRGAAHIYFNKDGKRVTTWICLDTDALTTIGAIKGKSRVKENLELLEDSSLLAIHYDDLERLYNESKEFERLGRLMITYYFGVMNNKLHQSYFLTAKERYEYVVRKHPEALLRIPLGIIASYLGISQETLSRIRNPKYGK